MPDGNDIVTRLRIFNHHLMVEAADEIERLRSLLAEREDADANNEHFRTTDGE